MPKPPSMTAIDAERAIGKARGSLYVTNANRDLVRKWCVAQGFPAAFVYRQPNWLMANAYNKVDGSGLEAMRAKLAEFKMPDIVIPAVDPEGEDVIAKINAELDAELPAVESPVEPQEEPKMPELPIAPTPPAGDAVALLRDLLLNGYKPGIDENQVRAIVQDQLAGIKPRVIEVRNGDKPPVRIEGLVHPEFERGLKYLQAGANVLLVGPAGCGKSHMAGQLAKALSVRFGTLSGSAGASEGELKGWLLPGEGGRFEYSPSEFVQCYENGDSLFCWDEMDAFDPNMLLVVNSALANGMMNIPLRKDKPLVKRGANVFLMGTANTYGTGANPLYAARNQLDEATRDRFVIITVDYDKRLEETIASAGGLTDAEMAGIWELRDRTREAGLRRVISTRAFQKAAIMKQCGDSFREIRDRLVEGWTKDERAKVGV